MRTPACRITWLVLLLGAVAVVGAELRQTAPGEAAQPGDGVLAQLRGTNLAMPPLPPKTPVQLFREVLAMKADEREKYLSTKPPEVRTQLERKISDYEAMPPELREATLRATQLYWYLNRFVQASGTNLQSQLASLPEPYQQIVTERVRQFAILPPPLQQEVLSYRSTSGYFLGNAADVINPNRPVPPLPPQPLEALNKMPVEERQRMYASFQHFFEMEPDAQRKVLARLPFAERARVERTLQALERMPEAQREQGLASVSKLISMSDEQQRRFFENAARWRELPQPEREMWLKLATRLPPLPPGPGLPPTPPLPQLLLRPPPPAMAGNPRN